MLEGLMHNGIILGLPSRTTGIMVYYINPPLPGLFEYPFMKGGTDERQRKIAKLYDIFFDEMAKWARNYDEMIAKQIRSMMPIDRVIPVKEEVEVGQDLVLPYEDIIKIIEKNDIILNEYFIIDSKFTVYFHFFSSAPFADSVLVLTFVF